MGKIKKANRGVSNHDNPLDKQILEGTYAKASIRVKKRKRQEEEEFVSEKLSKKILKQARLQQEHLEGCSRKERKEENAVSRQLMNLGLQHLSDSENELFGDKPDTEECYLDDYDVEALGLFMDDDPLHKEDLEDMIKEKLTEKKTEIESQFSDIASIKGEKFEMLKRLYEGVGKVLSRYRNGKLPKAFKNLPMRAGWEELLYVTEPENWTAAAMFQGTRLFTHNLNNQMAQRYFNLILLPRLRDDIAESKILNFHLYQALKKTLFRPSSFFKGIILPLCKSADCTLREATIIASILPKVSIPVLHASAAITIIAEMDHNRANSVFLRVLLEKKYALPYRTIDAVVNHFLRCSLSKTKMPLLWHQCLLTFAQIYKNDISTEQQDALLNLLTVHRHSKVTPEIRKELQSSTCRDTGVATMETMNTA